jgi:Domain of unknown function (DUF4280)
MPKLVVNGAMLACTFGVAPSSLVVASPTITAGQMPVAKITDMLPMTNIMTFGMCMTPSNPQVAAATSAALGVLTPQPCIPVTTAPWTPGSTKVQVSHVPAVNDTCTCMCTWGGMISVTNPGQMTVDG